jgi:hypothetical protein
MTASASQFTIVITALNKATAVFQQVDREAAKLAAPFVNIGKSIAALTEASGLKAVGEAALHAGQRVGELGRKVGELLGPLTALAGVASVAGLFEMAKAAAEYGEQLFLASQKTGIAVGQLGALHNAGEQTGLGVESMDKGLAHFNRTIAQTVSGHNKLAAQLFHDMHINLYKGHHVLKDTSTLLAELSDHFEHNTSVTQKNLAASILFARAGADWIPMLNMGGEEMRKLTAEFNHLHGPITAADAAISKQLMESFRKFHLSIMGVRDAIGLKLAPIIEKLLDPLTEMIAKYRDVIATKVAEWAQNVATAIKNIDWKGVGAAALAFGGAIKWVGDRLGAFWTTVAVAAVVFAPFIGATLEAAIAIGRLTWAMGVFIARALLFPVAALIADFVSLVPAIDSLSAAFVALDIAMDANPVGVFIIAAAAAIAIAAGLAYVIYENWEPIADFFVGLWSEVVQTFKWAHDNILPYLPGGVFVKMIEDNWGPITTFFESIWSKIVAIFQRNYAVLRPIIEALKWMSGYDVVQWVKGTAAQGHEIRYPTSAGDGIAPVGITGGVHVDYPRPMPPPSWGGGAVTLSPHGGVDVHIGFDNAPPGMRVGTSATGDVRVKPPTGVPFLW